MIGVDAALEKAAAYAAAWTSNRPEDVAAHYAEDGRVVINDGQPIIGRAAIASDYAAPFFTDIPGSAVLLHDFRLAGSHALFTGMLVGRAKGGGAVSLLGWEEWTLDASGLISQSLVWFNREEYERQVGGSV